ncbi:hypothetical protein D9613_000771 [Agrocybe pediades]|uniref:Uncharacterized protein n=1 Tax=Agrocybe pediades TaxID=84607 RepID=A0A8H4VT89_9AGAR|nr:hypothetical protein D9613_000771 [Agrocybe pediades]
MNSLYTSGVRQTNSLQADIERLRNGDHSPALLGQISASLSAMQRTIDDYDSMTKREIIKAKQEKAQMRVQKFRADYAELRSQFDRLRGEAVAAQQEANRAELISSSSTAPMSPQTLVADSKTHRPILHFTQACALRQKLFLNPHFAAQHHNPGWEEESSGPLTNTASFRIQTRIRLGQLRATSVGFDLSKEAHHGLLEKAVEGANIALNDVAHQFGEAMDGLDVSKVLDAVSKEAVTRFEDATHRVDALKRLIEDLINSAEELRLDADQVPVGKDSFSFNVFVQKLAGHVESIIVDLEKELALPSPENQTDAFKQRNATITLILDKVENAIVRVYALWDVSEAEARMRFRPVKTHIRDVILVIGKLADEHPAVANAIVVAAVMGTVPSIGKLIVLRPLLTVLGFGPAGPIKGSLAASMQRFFFGGMIIPGGWFSLLQSVSMKPTGVAIGIANALKLAIAGIVGGAKIF